MSDLVTIDPYASLYEFEEMRDPTFVTQFKKVKRSDLQAIDMLLAKGGTKEVVKTDSDWKLVEDLMAFFMERWPQEWQEFKSSIPEIRSTRGSGGYSKTKEIMYVGALPVRLNKLIKIMFPYQQFDKKFVWNLVKRIKILKVAGENN